MATLLLGRHGETTWNRDGRLQGWAPASLTDRGREQSRALGDHVADAYDVDRIVTSDLRRAVETTREVRRAHDSPPPFERSREWRERDFGVLQGSTYEELFDRHPEFDVFAVGHHAVEARPEDGENMLDVHERVFAALDELVAGLDDGETALVITHGGPTMSVLGTLRGLDPVTTVDDVSVQNCALTELRVTGDPDPAASPAFPEVVEVVREAEHGFTDTAPR